MFYKIWMILQWTFICIAVSGFFVFPNQRVQMTMLGLLAIGVILWENYSVSIKVEKTEEPDD